MTTIAAAFVVTAGLAGAVGIGTGVIGLIVNSTTLGCYFGGC